MEVLTGGRDGQLKILPSLGTHIIKDYGSMQIQVGLDKLQLLSHGTYIASLLMYGSNSMIDGQEICLTSLEIEMDLLVL